MALNGWMLQSGRFPAPDLISKTFGRQVAEAIRFIRMSASMITLPEVPISRFASRSCRPDRDQMDFRLHLPSARELLPH